MRRLLYLCLHPRNRSPSQRYRFEQFEPYLCSRGFEVEYASVLTEEDLQKFYAQGALADKSAIALRALARRAWSIRPRVLSPRFDVVLVQREAFFLFGAWSEWLAHLQAPLVFDFDDAIWIHVVSQANRRLGWLKNVDKVSRSVAMATRVIAGNDYLASWARKHNPSVEVIPTCVDTDRYRPSRATSTDRVVIGWCGSPSTVANLPLVLPALERVSRKYGARVTIQIMGDPNFRYPALGIVGERWTSDAEIPFLQSMDIGMMPSLDDEWAKGKCGLKGLTSMACGAATVMSPVGVNTSIIDDGENGLLASTEEEWFVALSRLIDDATLRRRLAANGRATVVDGYSVARWRERFCSALTESCA